MCVRRKKKKKITTHKNYGCIAADQMPQNIQRPAFIAANTDTSDQPGTHWVCFYIPSNGRKIEYFDSFGNRPRSKFFLQFLRAHGKKFVWNMQRLQSDFSAVCGHFRAEFLHHKCASRTLSSFVKKFDKKNYKQNDMKVLAMYAKISTDFRPSDIEKRLKIGSLNVNMCI